MCAFRWLCVLSVTGLFQVTEARSKVGDGGRAELEEQLMDEGAVREFFENFDTDKDGQLLLTEIYAAEGLSQDEAEVIGLAFAATDSENRGYITVDEVPRFQRALNELYHEGGDEL
uniref:EF-hand domain-containing protein n=1 Tax=Noctiluca scintillans TaxID=2966 RepID=A0A7S1F8H2_NOCSC|mmetsp:Transcript_43019/g.113360  ORF Transcript_43019/g.113360 Transcript_43019/m.113360 type:complete len:116 (+) Transcript_43019:52-399(+)